MRMGYAAAAILLLCVSCPSPAAAQLPGYIGPPAGFDCNKAATRIEHLICSIGDIAQEDGVLSASYARLLHLAPRARHPAIIQSQRDWLRQRDACIDKACLWARYSERDRWLGYEIDQLERALRRGVSRVGQCQVTRIEMVAPQARPGQPRSDFGPSSTSVSFANGVHQFSYDLEWPVMLSRPGDRARVCLVSIPQHCPPGDDRGRDYAVTNLRTGAKWRLYDSQHMCGGA